MQSGISETVHLVGCGTQKLDHAAPARDLYVGDLTRKAIRHASTRAGLFTGTAPCFILSAKHGLVDLDTVVEPYDESLAYMDRDERAEWARMVVAQLDELGYRNPDVFMVYAGADYLEPLRDAGLRVSEFFRSGNAWFPRSMDTREHRGVGARKGWFRRSWDRELVDGFHAA